MGDDGDSNYVLDRTELILLVGMQGELRCYNAEGVFLKVLCIRDHTLGSSWKFGLYST